MIPCYARYNVVHAIRLYKEHGAVMKKARIPWIFVLALLANPALAQEKGGISTYPAAFFSDSRPATAYDMIGRVPGFAFDNGLSTSVRGFAGSAGNVLVNGSRPTAKTDDLNSI